jgi:uncharacterized protein (TIGR00252 family)
MNTTSIGREAEGIVAEYLKKQGYKLLDQNWRTRFCEIDLVMTKNKTVYFIEVKYRSNNQYGSGLEYITSKKLQQMKFAAEMWLSNEAWKGWASLVVASVDHHMTVEVVELV